MRVWCPAAESNYGLVLTMDPLYRLTSGASFFLPSEAMDERLRPLPYWATKEMIEALGSLRNPFSQEFGLKGFAGEVMVEGRGYLYLGLVAHLQGPLGSKGDVPVDFIGGVPI